MNKAVQPICEIYNLNTNILLGALKDISDEDVVKRPENKANSFHFIAGHMLESRNILMQLMRMEVNSKWGELFGRGAKIVEQSQYPNINEIKKEWTICSQNLLKGLKDISDEKLAEKCPYDFPIEDKTILGAIAFLAFHDSYHVGQLGYLRPYFGYGQISG